MTVSQPLDVDRCPLEGIALIEASAGTGKTWAICGLVLRFLVEQERSIDQVLVVTFTNAATAELRERVRDRLVEVLAWLEDESAAQDPFIPHFVASLEHDKGLARPLIQARLKAALTAFDEASIFTIHGFCQRALGDSPFAAGQPFALELGDGSDLIREVVADFWRLNIAHGELPPAFIAWLTGRGFNPGQLESLLHRALKKPLATALWPDGLEGLPPPATADLEQAYQEAAHCWQAQHAEVIALLQSRLADLKYFTAADLDCGAREWEACFAAAQPLAPLGEQAACFRQSVLTGKKTRAGKAPPSHRFFELAERYCAARDDLDALLENHRLALYQRFLAWAPAAVAERKRARHRVDFDDLLLNLYRSLSGPRGETLAASLRQRFPVALIDEFQDTDPLQFAIFEAIYGSGAQPLFMVGDPKQAIYSFRQADLHTYLAARKKAAAHYHLDANQRSTAGVIAGINGLFGANPRAFMLDELDFLPARRGEKPLKPFTDASGLARSPFHFWQLPGDDETLLSKAEALHKAAAASAEEIARLLGAARQGLVSLGGQPLSPGRVAVLVRTHKQGRLMQEALARVGLRAAEMAQDSVFSSNEAEDLERLLRALLEPARTGLLKAALATPLVGLDAAAIAVLGEDDAALGEWIARFSRWQQCWQARGIAVALGELGEGLNVAARLLGMADGERRLTNHLHLTELLHQAEAELAQPGRLLHWFAAQRREPGADEAAQLRLESDQDLVNIVTIHRAKGLEYDLVFCPFLWEGGINPKGDGLPGQAYHDQDQRLVLDYRAEGEALGKAAAKLEQAAELLRLYYVALTRPVQRCYLVWGPYGKAGKNGMSRTESSRSLLNWLVAGQDMSPEAWLTVEGRKLPDALALNEAWQGLIRSLEACSEALPEPGRHVLAATTASGRYQAREARRHLRPNWRIDSFSSLLRGTRLPDHDGSDHDALVPWVPPGADGEPPAGAASVAPTDCLHFPRGARAGDCVHHLFEHVDFSQPDTWAPAIAAALDHHPPGDPALRPEHQAMLGQLLSAVLHTPLALPGSRTPLQLASLDWSRRKVEMEFHLPMGRLDPQGLQTLLAAHGEAVPRLGFPALQGFLKGYIDLVFAHEGRYYVLDWKSNHLGWSPGDYGPAAMDSAMLEHGYRLQARLYLLALHRFLAFRLPGYDPARHLGGACYLFVRGVRPGWQVDEAQGRQQAGVCLLPPRPELMLALEGLLG